MNPLDSSAIPDRAVGSFLRLSARSASAKRVHPRNTEISRGAGGLPSEAEAARSLQGSKAAQPSFGWTTPSRASTSSAAWSPSRLSPAAGKPRALIREAEEVLLLVTTSASSAVFRR